VPAVVDARAMGGPWAPDFAGGYTPPFFDKDEALEQ
jgi:hypothetical protein